MSSPTSWMPFWLAATWARRSDRLSCRFRVPLQPGILPGARRASVTAGRVESPLSRSPAWGLPAPHLLGLCWALWAPHVGPPLAPTVLLTPSRALKTHSFLPAAEPSPPHTSAAPTKAPGWGRRRGQRGRRVAGTSVPRQSLLPPSLPLVLPSHLLDPLFIGFFLGLALSPGEKPLPLAVPHSHCPQSCGPTGPQANCFERPLV